MPCKPLSCVFGNFIFYQRYVLVIMLQLALLNAYHLRVVLNIALTEIIQPANETEVDACPEYEYERVPVKGSTYDWPNKVEALILYSFFIGYMFGHIPAGWLSDKLGGRHVMGGSMMLSALLNLFIPLVITKVDYMGVVIMRALMGLVQGPVFPAISSFIQCWIPQRERGFLGAAAFGGSNLGTLTGGVMTGVIIKYTESWAMPFYVWSLSAAVWYFFYLFMVFSKPKTHPFITEKEHEYLKAELGDTKTKFKVPWGRLLTSMPVWALFAAQWGHNYIYFTMFTTLPKYMKEILKLNITANSAFSTLPFFSLWISATLFGLLADVIVNKSWMSVVVVRKLYTSLGAIIPSFCILMTAYVGCNRAAAIAFYTIGVTLLGPFFSGMKVNVNDISSNYAGTIMAFINGLGASAGVIGPFVVGEIVTHSSLYEWKIVYWIQVGVAFGISIFYVIFAKAERQAWDFPEEAT